MNKNIRNILLGIYIINFFILLIIYINNIMDKELDVKNYFAVYFWIINLVEIIIFIANLKRTNKKRYIALQNGEKEDIQRV